MKPFDKNQYQSHTVDEHRKPVEAKLYTGNPANSHLENSSDFQMIEHCINQLEDKGLDITSNYDDWLRIGFAFASLGESGREYFHRVSAFYPDYSFRKVDKKFNYCLRDYKGDIDLGTFFYYCKNQGIELKEAPSSDKVTSTDDIRKPQKRKASVLKFSGQELLNRKMDKIPTLVDPIIPEKGLICLAGSSDIGKSSLLRQLTLYIVNGKERVLGFKINTRYRRAIYVSTEDDDSSISFLIKKQVDGIKDHYCNYSGLSYIFDYGDDIIETLDEELEQNPVDVICIDALTDLYTGNMNQTNAIRSFLNDFSQLANRHNCLIIFLHHTGKKTEELEPSKHNLLGSQGFEAKMRLVLELRHDWHDTSLRHLCVVKGNYLPKEYKHESFVLRFDEDMLFHNTGERVPFAQLAKPDKNDDQAEKKEDRVDEIIGLKSQGMSLREIEQETGISKSTVHRILKDHETKPGSSAHQIQPEFNLKLSRPGELY